jgi:Fe-S-cluster containining protein
MDADEVQAVPDGRRNHLVIADSEGSWTKTKVNAQGYTVCAALTGTVANSCQCSIYTARPLVCRLFEAGSPECLEARKLLGIHRKVVV